MNKDDIRAIERKSAIVEIRGKKIVMRERPASQALALREIAIDNQDESVGFQIMMMCIALSQAIGKRSIFERFRSGINTSPNALARSLSFTELNALREVLDDLEGLKKKEVPTQDQAKQSEGTNPGD
jgi:hypothetical protein